jgi:DNA repair protein RadC
VAPVVLAAELLEVLLEKGTHGNDAVSHALDLTKPLLVERRVV